MIARLKRLWGVRHIRWACSTLWWMHQRHDSNVVVLFPQRDIDYLGDVWFGDATNRREGAEP